MFAEMSGARDIHESETGPRSMTKTEMLGSSVRRDAKTHPEVPPAKSRELYEGKVR